MEHHTGHASPVTDGSVIRAQRFELVGADGRLWGVLGRFGPEGDPRYGLELYRPDDGALAGSFVVGEECTDLTLDRDGETLMHVCADSEGASIGGPRMTVEFQGR